MGRSFRWPWEARLAQAPPELPPLLLGQLTSVAGTWMQLAAGVGRRRAHPHSRGACHRASQRLPVRPVHAARLVRGCRDRPVRQPPHGDRDAATCRWCSPPCGADAARPHPGVVGGLCDRRAEPEPRSCSNARLTFQMVGKDALPNAVALNSSLFDLARIFGPAIAGVVAVGRVVLRGQHRSFLAPF